MVSTSNFCLSLASWARWRMDFPWGSLWLSIQYSHTSSSSPSSWIKDDSREDSVCGISLKKHKPLSYILAELPCQ